MSGMQPNPDYGNWVPGKLIYLPIGIGLILGGLSLMLPVLAVGAIVFFLFGGYFAFARHRFSPKGGNIQARIQDLVVSCLDWNGEGKVLDIGCGNGPLTIALAEKCPLAEVVGIDYWGRAWEYSKRVCERNADIAGVAGRVSFQKASASALPFNDGAFDAAVSNLVFHEVKDIRDKKMLIKEALRVVKKGGSFALQDLFLWKRIYGEVDDLLETIRSWGIERVEFLDTSRFDSIPKALKLPFMVGTMGILHGQK